MLFFWSYLLAQPSQFLFKIHSEWWNTMKKFQHFHWLLKRTFYLTKFYIFDWTNLKCFELSNKPKKLSNDTIYSNPMKTSQHEIEIKRDTKVSRIQNGCRCLSGVFIGVKSPWKKKMAFSNKIKLSNAIATGWNAEAIFSAAWWVFYVLLPVD